MSNEQKKIISHNVVMLVVLTVVLSLFVGFFIFSDRANAPSGPGVVDGVGVLPENPPFSVKVEDLGNGERVVSNEDAGYEVKINENHYIYRDKVDGTDLVIQDFLEPNTAYGGVPGCKVSIEMSQGSLTDVEKYAKQECDLDSECIEYSVKEKSINDTKWFSIVYSGEFVGSGNPEFKSSKDDKIYTLYFFCNDDIFVDGVLKNISI